MPALEYTLEPFYAGDHFPGIPTLKLKDKLTGLPPASPLVAATLRFGKVGNVVEPVVELSIEGTEITLVDGAGWEMSIPTQAVAGFTDGTWTGHLRTIPADGVKTTYIIFHQTVKADV